MKTWYNICVVVALLLGGCTVINPNSRVSDWPKLEEIVNYVSPEEMKETCGKYTSGLFSTPLACSEWDFDKGTCVITLVLDSPAWMYEHEHMHCLGYDHYGSTYMQEDWDKWKEQHK